MKNSAKKRFAAFVAALVLLLAGCGKTGAQKSESPEAKPAETGGQTVPAAQSADQSATVASDPKAAYEAYLKFVQDNRADILTYNWQKGMDYDEDRYEYLPVSET
ncbi:MAG: hypothetical protein J5449_01010, partial [Oscillospiraceae bacterium]|nr:hypothetical protein [Oscillospiraceae bacterium]